MRVSFFPIGAFVCARFRVDINHVNTNTYMDNSVCWLTLHTHTYKRTYRWWYRETNAMSNQHDWAIFPHLNRTNHTVGSPNVYRLRRHWRTEFSHIHAYTAIEMSIHNVHTMYTFTRVFRAKYNNHDGRSVRVLLFNDNKKFSYRCSNVMCMYMFWYQHLFERCHKPIFFYKPVCW